MVHCWHVKVAMRCGKTSEDEVSMIRLCRMWFVFHWTESYPINLAIFSNVRCEFQLFAPSDIISSEILSSEITKFSFLFLKLDNTVISYEFNEMDLPLNLRSTGHEEDTSRNHSRRRLISLWKNLIRFSHQLHSDAFLIVVLSNATGMCQGTMGFIKIIKSISFPTHCVCTNKMGGDGNGRTDNNNGIVCFIANNCNYNNWTQVFSLPVPVSSVNLLRERFEKRFHNSITAE